MSDQPSPTADSPSDLLRPLLLRASLLALPAWLLRSLAVIGEMGSAAGDPRGYGSDMLVAVFVAGLSMVIFPPNARWRRDDEKPTPESPRDTLLFRILPFGALSAWSLLLIGNDEHVRTLGGLATYDQGAYLLDSTFVLGSVLPILGSPRTWFLLSVVLFATHSALRLDTRAGKSSGPPRLRPRLSRSRYVGAAAMLIAALILLAWPLDPAASSWRQMQVLEHNARLLDPGTVDRDPRSAAPDPSALAGASGVAADDSGPGGEPLVPEAPGRSVILVMLEGISNGHLPSIAQRQGLPAPPFLPLFDQELTRLSEPSSQGPRILAYPHFVQSQRQTNRGEYALLCGRPPRLLGGRPKMSDAVADGAPEHLSCLPEALRLAGYRTAYLQAAPLSFMLKDRFMPKIGFEKAWGDEYFESAYSRNEWGVDDRTFFEQSRGLIEDLRNLETPYFLTLLTVGTHHPFNVPAEHAAAFPNGSLPWAISYLDQALASFLRWLHQSRVLEDTLVLFVADESAGFGKAPDAVSELLVQSWGLMISLVPEDRTGTTAEESNAPFYSPHLFAQTDLPLSIVDHLAIDGQGAAGADFDFRGRSLFRRQSEPRDIAFGNIYLQRIGLLSTSGRLTTCTYRFEGCTNWHLEPERLFSLRRKPADGSTEEAVAARALLESTARASQYFDIPGHGGPSTDDGDPDRGGSVVALMPTGDQQRVHASRLESPSAESEIEVRIRVAAEGVEDIEGRPTRVWLVHDLLDDQGKRIYQRGVELADAQGVGITYRVLVGGNGPKRLESRLWVARFDGADVKLRIFEAALETLAPSESGNGANDPLSTGVRVIGGEPEFFEVGAQAESSSSPPRVAD